MGGHRSAGRSKKIALIAIAKMNPQIGGGSSFAKATAGELETVAP
jgi:hypothetical protein